jgi:murein DD-endopeptidase MepM/ murein hydrolase activator NlpD
MRFTMPASTAAVPSYVRPISGPRILTQKRFSRIRVNWFVLGTIFGIGASFFMNLLVGTVILPRYEKWVNAPVANPVQLARLAPVVAVTLPPPLVIAPPPSPPEIFPKTVDLRVAPGDTLVDMLVAQRVEEGEAHQVVAALKREFNPGKLRVGQKISLTLAQHERLGDRTAVKELAINLPNLSTVELERLSSGDFSVAAIKAELLDHATHASGTVRSSLYQAADDAGIPSSVMGEIVRAFSYDVDFQRDIHPGDKIEVVMDRQTTVDGRVGGYHNARYASLTLKGRKIEIFRFADARGGSSWYNAKGESVVKSLLRTPIHAARITSGYGMRKHPIMGYSKMHRGVDFGAAIGTPILAAGDGTITFRGWKNGYGNYVQIRHNNTYSTAYGHISRFGNIRIGGRVKQGQVIAFVGSTGMSTGPHLHYEVMQNGQQVNPTAQKFNTAQALAGAELQKFKSRQSAILKELASLRNAGSQQVASR